MIKIKDKKASEMAIGTMVMLVLALLVLVVVALGFWKGWDYVFGSMGLLPNDLNKAVTVCQQYATSDMLSASFCEKKALTINNIKGTYNCNDIYNEAIKTMAPDKIGYERDTTKCTVVESCKGTPTACKSLVEADCNVQKGCTWSSTACTGISTACPSITASVEADCNVQKGCTWS